MTVCSLKESQITLCCMHPSQSVLVTSTNVKLMKVFVSWKSANAMNQEFFFLRAGC